VLTPEEFNQDQLDLEEGDLWLERDTLKKSLHEFVKAAWHVVEPSIPFVDNWHIKEICGVLERAGRPKKSNPVLQQRIIINVPPGTLKSLLVSVFWPAWIWAKNPRKRFLTAAYGSHLTIRDNLRMRDLVDSAWYQRLFPLKLIEDQNTKTRFNTSEGGWRIATSVSGIGTGEHPDYIIIDDAMTAQQAESDVERETVTKWYDRTISTRGAARGCVTVVVAQRLHEDDLPGYLLKRGGWYHVCFPMRYEPTRPATAEDPGHTADPLDHRHEPNELLIPQLFDEEKVRTLERDLGPYGTAGQLAQRPSPEGGGLFKREWFKFLDVAPKHITRRARGWDTAATADGGDYTRGVKVSETEAELYIVEDAVGDQLSPAGVDSLMLQTAQADGKFCCQREEKEGGASGKTVVLARTRLLKGFDYAFVAISGSKVTRAKPFRSQCEAGNVFLLRTGNPSKDAWIEEFIRELCAFPTGKHDDYVDAVTCAFNAVLLEPKRRRVRSSW
jgi:predicted phage terminase large subunit-like protein